MKIRLINGDQDIELRPENGREILLIGKLSGKLGIATVDYRTGTDNNPVPTIDIPITALIQAAIKP